jgi:superfamily II DNA or RNA helicase
MIKLRDYQEKAKRLYFDEEQKEKLIVLPTGAGKTIVFSSIIHKHIKDKGNANILIIAHRKELLHQAKEKLLYFGINAEIDNIHAHININSVQKINNRLEEYSLKEYDLIVIDEVHHIMSKSYLKIIKHIKYNNLLGVTATPNRTDNIGLGHVFKNITYSISIGEMIENKNLVGIKTINLTSNVDISNVGISKGDFNVKELSNKINTEDRNNLILENYLKHCITSKTIIFTVSVEQAETLNNLFRENNINSDVVHGKMCRTDRERILNDLKNEPDKVIINCMILTEGFDEPSILNVIIARPTKSESLLTQMIGRGLRLYENKKYCKVLNILDIDTKMRNTTLDKLKSLQLEECTICKDYVIKNKSLTCLNCGQIVCFNHSNKYNQICHNCIEEIEHCGIKTKEYVKCANCGEIFCKYCGSLKDLTCNNCIVFVEEIQVAKEKNKKRTSKKDVLIFGNLEWYQLEDKKNVIYTINTGNIAHVWFKNDKYFSVINKKEKGIFNSLEYCIEQTEKKLINAYTNYKNRNIRKLLDKELELINVSELEKDIDNYGNSGYTIFYKLDDKYCKSIICHTYPKKVLTMLDKSKLPIKIKYIRNDSGIYYIEKV